MTCDTHDQAIQRRFTNHNCTSVIGETPDGHGLLPYNLNIKMYTKTPSSYTDSLDVQNADGSWQTVVTTYTCHSAGDDDINRFQDDFRAAIHRHWNGKLWLATSRRTRRDIKGLKCGISLEFTRDLSEADLTTVMLYRPEPPANVQAAAAEFRAFCSIEGRRRRTDIDMVIDYPPNNSFDVHSPRDTSNHGRITIHQNFAAHEFGHYIGLHHTCRDPASPNQPGEYCDQRSRGLQQNIMACGNVIQREHAAPWKNRLSSHHYYCGVNFSAHTHRERPP